MLRLSNLGLVAGTPLVALTLLCCANASAQPVSSPCRPSVTGQIDLIPLVSRVLHNQRFLRVWVPPGYSDPGSTDKRYPVLYVLDGNLLFGDCGYGMQNPDWGIDETLTALIAKGAVPPMIVVGIESVIREYELVPYRDPFFLQNSPEPIGRLFPEFLAQDIIPVITKRYRVASGPQAIGGWSYGAVAALWALITRPDLFNIGLLESPSLGIGNGQLLRDTDHLFAAPNKVFIGAGDNEFPTKEGNRGYLDALALLEQHFKAALQGPAQVKTVIVAGAKHSVTASAQRFSDAMLFLFGR
jgi:predicted alpha/beta superfamily hydrolase